MKTRKATRCSITNTGFETRLKHCGLGKALDQGFSPFSSEQIDKYARDWMLLLGMDGGWPIVDFIKKRAKCLRK